MLTLLVDKKANRISSINLSMNHLYTLDIRSMRPIDQETQQNPFKLIKKYSQIDHLSINLSCNQLKGLDMLLLLLNLEKESANQNLLPNQEAQEDVHAKKKAKDQ